MKKRDYSIEIHGLSQGNHEFNFEINNQFFDLFEDVEEKVLNQATLSVNADLRKTPTMIEINFHVSGSYKLECDRSLRKFDHAVSFDHRFIFKYGDPNEEMGDDVKVISDAQQNIELADILYEIISLSVPMKKLHPEESEEEVVYYSTSTDDEEAEEEASNDSNEDPRWAALKKLKGN
ncbi:MAG: DUF177 domain-containing protein [Cyclobacteriaceae bacterium]|nr:DUF177 domain-containing protein [Cyclobacteriaceae bacterium]MCH8516317.1 DUF177 domain-containing protein [Cyclobacteriaceae bacterium]